MRRNSEAITTYLASLGSMLTHKSLHPGKSGSHPLTSDKSDLEQQHLLLQQYLLSRCCKPDLAPPLCGVAAPLRG
jgi:hypothetical protein